MMSRLEKKILVIRLKDFFSYDEIATMLGMSKRTVVKYVREVEYGV